MANFDISCVESRIQMCRDWNTTVQNLDKNTMINLDERPICKFKNIYWKLENLWNF